MGLSRRSSALSGCCFLYIPYLRKSYLAENRPTMYKNFLYPILISLLISSCANQRNSSDRWNKKQITSACDCADMAVDFFTEMIDDVKKNPEMTEE